MVKIAMISDLHLDINKVNVADVITQQSEWLAANQIQVYLIAGDLFNHFDKSLQFAEALQQATPGTAVRFVAGNHDMVNDISYDELQQSLSPTYLHRRYYDIPRTDWRVVGNNGWYDYSFSAKLHRPEADFLHWKRAYWIDGAIQQPMTDPERLALELSNMTAQFKAAQAAHKHILFVTHFVPRIEYVRVTDDNRFWNMANAMLGSVKIGQLLTKYHVQRVLFGHIHIHPAPRRLDAAIYYNQALGYGTARRHEWLTDTFETEWLTRLRVITL